MTAGAFDVNAISPEQDEASDYDVTAAEFVFTEYVVEELEKAWSYMDARAQETEYGFRIAHLLHAARGRRDRLRAQLVRLRTPED